MGTYSKDVDSNFVKDLYKTLLNRIKDVKIKRCESSLAYFITCLYEYLIISVCIREVENGNIKLRLTKDKEYVILNIIDVSRCIDNKTRLFLISLKDIANVLRHENCRIIDCCKDFLELIMQEDTISCLSVLLSNENEKELYRFLTNKLLIVSIFKEVFNTNEMKSICRKIVNYYVKNTSGNKTVKDIIREMQRKSGCSFDFACHEFVGTGLQRLEY